MLCAISDIHGHLHALEEALENVSLSGDNRLVLLGDYTDYGPRSGEVLRSIYGLQQRQGPEKEDVLIILGDAGVNYYLTRSDYDLKQELNDLPITLFLIQGNHEERPEEIDTYEERPWRGGVVYAEPEFPSLLFAKDGEIYDLDVGLYDEEETTV